MKAKLVRKAASAVDWSIIVKERDIAESLVIIEKRITINDEEYESLRQNFFEDRQYITENSDIMYFKDNEYHCILVTAEGEDSGIIIESEGCDYARYAAVVKLCDCDDTPKLKLKWFGREEAEAILAGMGYNLVKKRGEYMVVTDSIIRPVRLCLKWNAKGVKNTAVWEIQLEEQTYKTVREISTVIGCLEEFKRTIKSLQRCKLSYSTEE